MILRPAKLSSLWLCLLLLYTLRLSSQPDSTITLFHYTADNGLPQKAFYALAEHNALGFGPFGIESLASDMVYAQSNAVLTELLPVITKYQGTGNMRGILKEKDEDSAVFLMGKYRWLIQFDSKEKKGYGLIIQTDSEDFILAGTGFRASVTSIDKKMTASIGYVTEGEFNRGKWVSHRVLNGDETWHNAFVFAEGRKYEAHQINGKRVMKQELAPLAVLNQALENNLRKEQIKAPGIYVVKVFKHPW